MFEHDHSHDFVTKDQQLAVNERKTLIVVILTAVMMAAEITAGYITGSMALLADGWHMASHAGALSIALIAYRVARSTVLRRKFSFGAGKFIPLGGYSSAIVLAIIAILMAVESFVRLLKPVTIEFKEAIAVAVVGLIVNVISALILSHDHHHEHGHHHDLDEDHDHHHNHHHDHNLRSAYVHVLADTLTSVLAIVALTVGLFYGANWLDPVMGIIGSLVILKWAFGLCRDAGWELLDGHAKSVNLPALSRAIEATGAEIVDLHVWKIAPSAVSCALVVRSESTKGSSFYRELLQDFNLAHLTIEERIAAREG